MVEKSRIVERFFIAGQGKSMEATKCPPTLPFIFSRNRRDDSCENTEITGMEGGFALKSATWNTLRFFKALDIEFTSATPRPAKSSPCPSVQESTDAGPKSSPPKATIGSSPPCTKDPKPMQKHRLFCFRQGIREAAPARSAVMWTMWIMWVMW